VLPTPCFVFSDAHLGAVPDAVEASVLSLLRTARREAKSLIINGDLFDFWFEWRHVMPRKGFRVIAALADLRDAGVEIRWHAGNHDGWGGDLLRRDVGLDYSNGPYRGPIGGWRAVVHHGDGLRPEADRSYRRWARVLRHPWSIAAYRWIHPDIGTALALGTSATSRAHNAHDEGAGLRDVAFGMMARERGPSLVIFGHSHARTLLPAPGGGVYGNPGAWFDDPVYLRIDDTTVSLVRHLGSAQGDVLDVRHLPAEEARG
jgi:UDP-2,3-diacylglucosamine hydrolase